MTIPEIEHEIRNLSESLVACQCENKRLQDDISELRRQIGVERAPQECVKDPYPTPLNRIR